MPRFRTWSDEQFVTAVEQSMSYAQVLTHLGLAISGSGYQTVKTHIERLQLDTTHFTGMSGAMRYGKSKNLKLEHILVAGSNYQSCEIRRFVLRAGLKENRCEVCEAEDWLDRPLTIQLHHKNKVRNDHRLENLQMLCPNCHSQQ